MGSCDIKSSIIHSWTSKATIRVADKVLDTPEQRCRRVSSIYGETVDIAHKVRSGILNNVDKFANMGTDVSGGSHWG